MKLDRDALRSDFQRFLGREVRRESIEEVLEHVSWAAEELAARRAGGSLRDLREEQGRLLNALNIASDRLHAASSDLRASLGPRDVDECIDRLDRLRERLAQALAAMMDLERDKDFFRARGPKPRDVDHAVAVELAIRLLRAMRAGGAVLAATSDGSVESSSLAVRSLQAAGDAIGLRLSPATWRDTISAARDAAPDLK